MTEGARTDIKARVPHAAIAAHNIESRAKMLKLFSYFRRTLSHLGPTEIHDKAYVYDDRSEAHERIAIMISSLQHGAQLYTYRMAETRFIRP